METTQKINIKEAKPNEIGGIITGIDIRDLSPESEEIIEIRRAIYRNKLVVIRNQDFTPSQYVDFTKKLGTPQVYFQKNYHHPDFPEIFVSSNVNKEGEKVGVAGTGHYWHTDCQFEQNPLSFTSITPIIIPKTIRETRYINMHQVYNNLPDHLKEFVKDATLIHGGNNRYKVTPEDIDKSIQQLIDKMNEMVPFVKHPAVIEHPVTGDKILYASRGFTMKFDGISYEENQKILNELFDFIEKKEHIHAHSWEKGDLIIWDNRYLLHMSSPLAAGDKSKSYRIGIYDDQPFYVGL
ncbi:TauD/TfdA dioxygenase family protein [Aquimarina muelleri]|uniref:Dioxygenase n=1 Tax=Aquimarina muelleri TaxID=279356 RepID=A0A918N390_9FLAO|nr:TauD/TfdA family dioxygenase [Aquimarina muelleri]MCX2762272.1 TauD/TfdA family dioxygenase [Aquimarina muelleri]GGX17923.1 putative dioxygenase [Aquimarina muelleri]